jgi:3-methyl-2-oxobutanoate hydroxymethyltransferase
MKPRFVKRYADLYSDILQALKTYKDEVQSGKFPEQEHSFGMNSENIPKLY